MANNQKHLTISDVEAITLIFTDFFIFGNVISICLSALRSIFPFTQPTIRRVDQIKS